MSANRFATMLHRNTNKIMLILIYAVLEWILIVLLLLSSTLSCLIMKFAEFFGLKPPCPWCTRIDHVFDPAKGDKNMNREFVCEVHSKEISKLGFCTNHEKLVDSGNICEDCFSSRPEFDGPSRNFGSSEKMKEFGNFLCDKEKIDENGEVRLNCSCCGVRLESNDKYSSYILLKTSSWDDDVLECAHEQSLITETGDYVSDEKVSDFAADLYGNQMISEFERNLGKKEEHTGFICVTVNELKESEREEDGILQENANSVMEDKSVQVCVEEDYVPPENSTQHLEFSLDCSGHNLVPVELIDSVIEGHKIKEDAKIEQGDIIKGREVGLDSDINEEPKYALLDSMDIEEDENSLFIHSKGSHLETGEFENFGVFRLARWPSEEVSGVQELAGDEREKHSDVQIDIVACDQENNENEADVSIGTEIPDLDITDELQIQGSENAYESIHEDPLTSSASLYVADENASMQIEEQTVETQSFSVHDRDHIISNEPSDQMELKEIEEDKVLGIPTSMESLNSDNKLLLLEKRDSGTEESLDGSVTSELDGFDGVVTIERLKSALRAARKALQALYVELEEERSASAVATNQTMAMINRLQEEKAAMQMEALQYQRMMEEQSEYDQEALQLLNELMVKREKEKQELERELEVYRKKLYDYETNEKMSVLKKNKDGSVRSGFSSASCSNAEDSDGNSDMSNQNIPIHAVVKLEYSLADFEEERLSILGQLKVLEEKLSALDDENKQHFEDVKEMDDLHEYGHSDVEENGHENCYSDGKHYKHRRIAGRNGKSLVPLLDAISDENENGDVMINGNENGFNSNGVHDSYESKSEMVKKKLSIDEEVDHLYGRLQALEVDREFLKHCVGSLKKGDKGMDLLQEILQHLRDLRNVELRVRNLGDGAIIRS